LRKKLLDTVHVLISSRAGTKDRRCPLQTLNGATENAGVENAIRS